MSSFNRGHFLMLVITVYAKENTTLFEFGTEREAFKKISDCRILSEVIYFHDPCLTVAAVSDF